MLGAFALGTMTDSQLMATEYVVGRRGGQSLGNRALPWAFDDLGRDLGDDIYERMLLDPVVLAAVNVLRASILAEGLQLAPAVDDPEADGYDLAREICDFCESNLAGLELPADDLLWDMALALPLGSRVAEIVYSPAELARGRLILQSIKPRPRRATAFVVDPHNRVLGLAAQRPGESSPLIGSTWYGAVTEDGDLSRGLLPREKFFILSFRPRDADPRGTTILRSAYNPWWVKQQAWPELLKYLAQFASPSLVGTVAEKAQPVKELQADGKYREISATVALKTALESFRNGSVLAVPYGTVVDTLSTSDGGGAFFQTIDLADRQITMGILHQTLATLEGQHQTRAASETHADILGTIIRQARRAVASTFRRDVLVNLVRYTYGDRALPLVPAVSLGVVEQTDLAALATAIAQLARAQYLHPSQYAGLDQLLGLPPRDTQQDPAGPGGASTAAESSVSPLDEEPQLTNVRAAATGTLIRAGFDPNDARAVTGLPPIRHTGAAPVTVREQTPEDQQA